MVDICHETPMVVSSHTYHIQMLPATYHSGKVHIRSNEVDFKYLFVPSYLFMKRIIQ